MLTHDTDLFHLVPAYTILNMGSPPFNHTAADGFTLHLQTPMQMMNRNAVVDQKLQLDLERQCPIQHNL